MMRKGTENRRIGETNMNRESSRSHSVFTCIMESSSKGAEDSCTRVKFSRLNLVDLAGRTTSHCGIIQFRNRFCCLLWNAGGSLISTMHMPFTLFSL